MLFNKKPNKFYTKEGDLGKTKLRKGTVVYKDSAVIEFVGLVDQLSAELGIVKSHILKINNPEISLEAENIQDIQKDLFIIKNMALGEVLQIDIKKEIDNIEVTIDDYVKLLKDKSEDLLPGGSLPSSHLYLASSLSRKIERKIVRFRSEAIINILPYFNRLSDLLFLMAKFVNQELGFAEAVVKRK